MHLDRFPPPLPTVAHAWGEAALLAVMVAAFIVYGTLFPFAFRMPVGGMEGVQAALAVAMRHGPGSRGDLLANVVLYLPLGLFAGLALLGREPWRFGVPAAVAIALALGTALSTGLEVGQIFLPYRTPSRWDVLLNGAGSALGAVGAALAVRSGLAARLAPGRIGTEPFAALLVMCWLGYRLYPYYPVIDLHKYLVAMRPLLLYPAFEPSRALHLAVLWFLAAHLLDAVAGAEQHRKAGRLLVPSVLLGALLGQVLIVGRMIHIAEILGVGLALLGWWLLRPPARQGKALLVLVLGIVLLDRLRPFVFLPEPRLFDWMPHLSPWRGSWAIELQTWMYRAFLYGGLLWLLVRRAMV